MNGPPISSTLSDKTTATSVKQYNPLAISINVHFPPQSFCCHLWFSSKESDVASVHIFLIHDGLFFHLGIPEYYRCVKFTLKQKKGTEKWLKFFSV